MPDLVDSQLLTVAEVQRALRISRSAAYKLVESGDVESFRIGGSIRVPAESVLSYLERHFVARPGASRPNGELP